MAFGRLERGGAESGDRGIGFKLDQRVLHWVDCYFRLILIRGRGSQWAKPIDGEGSTRSAPAFLAASSCSLLLWRRRLGIITLLERLSSEHLMGLPVVIVRKRFLQSDFQLPHIFMHPEVNARVFERPPEPFDEHFVHPVRFPIHTLRDPAPFHRSDPCTACELAALISVEDLPRPSCCFQCLAQGFPGRMCRPMCWNASRTAPPAVFSP